VANTQLRASRACHHIRAMRLADAEPPPKSINCTPQRGFSCARKRNCALPVNFDLRSPQVPTDVNGIVYSRTPAQVVSIATLGSTNGTGGFFPAGARFLAFFPDVSR